MKYKAMSIYLVTQQAEALHSFLQTGLTITNEKAPPQLRWGFFYIIGY
jgi:hypothetical protein